MVQCLKFVLENTFLKLPDGQEQYQKEQRLLPTRGAPLKRNQQEETPKTKNKPRAPKTQPRARPQPARPTPTELTFGFR